MSQRRHIRTSAVEDTTTLDRAVTECVRYIFSREGSKIPIKRAEILKYLQNACETTSNQISSVMVEANKVLKTVYGYKLVQVEAKNGVQYIVVLDEECQSLSSSVIDPQQRRILIACLIHIFMSGGPVKEDDMWKFLSESGLIEENDYAGRKSFISTTTKQMYLLYTKVGDGELARNIFEWGKRATEELPKIFLLNKLAEALGKTPDHWYEQYKEATEGT
ncbi:non-structural maintenance of chromosomes element 3 homolog [Papilio machaon]|uniref:non-structural maintenance of chromosomes element 3 homolog n=1 Tax=Papilio machaon TaxID=76193 RepID=UPI001E6643CF|nr:non-structural maintenance of chromosomes element 3 homolog [Papilio machaon]